MTIKQIDLIQLIVFLERRPFADFPNLQAFNKVNGAITDLKKQLGDYYKEYEKLETAQVLAGQPFLKRASELRDTFKNDEEALKKALDTLQEEANEDKKVKSSFKALNDFKSAEDNKQTEIQIQNPDYKVAVKDIFEAQALKFDQWINRETLSNLSAYLGV